MSYKGNDLDLRTPFVLADEAAALPGLAFLADIGQDMPIPVDHIVLACCNSAYETAVFHGTGDVRLEHLLYSLARVEAAREMLEQQGVRTQQLRRESAAAIAANAPAAHAGKLVPRASAELGRLLRDAAGGAGQDGAPASIRDILRAMLNLRGQAPATALLLRSAGDLQRLERWVAEARAHPSQPGSALTPFVAQELVPRLELLETAMRTLVAETASDRKAMLHMLGELQYELRAARQESSRPVIVIEKIEDLGKSVAGLSEHLDTMRTLAPVDTVESRLAALESRLGDQPGAIANAISYMLDERRASEPEVLQLTPADTYATEVGQKLEKLETMLREQWKRIEQEGRAHERLKAVFERLVKLEANQKTLAENLDGWRLDHAGDFGIVSNRLKDLEQMLHDFVSPPRSS